MRFFIIAAAVAVATVLVATSHPADAGYIAPDAPWSTKAFCQSSC